MHNNEETEAVNVFMESTLAIFAQRNLHYCQKLKHFQISVESLVNVLVRSGICVFTAQSSHMKVYFFIQI